MSAPQRMGDLLNESRPDAESAPGGLHLGPPRKGHRKMASCGQRFQGLIPAPIRTRFPVPKGCRNRPRETGGYSRSDEV